VVRSGRLVQPGPAHLFKITNRSFNSEARGQCDVSLRGKSGGMQAFRNGRVAQALGRDRMMVVLLGPPGSGKGTQGRMLSAALRVPILSTGNLFREEIAKGTELGCEVKAVVERGELVRDDLVNILVASRLGELDCSAGCVLDGFPRNIEQAHFLKGLESTIADSPVVLDLKVEAGTLISRLTARWYCRQCGRTYSLHGRPSTLAGRCNDDGAPLVQRSDDKETVIHERMDQYRRLSGPLREFYGEQSYYEIAATGSPAMVFRQLMKILAEERKMRTVGAGNMVSVTSDRS
jgi:adenylate kinase